MAVGVDNPKLERVLDTAHFRSKIFIKGVQIKSINVKNLVIREWILDILPTLELIIIDDGNLVDLWPLEDNDDIRVEVSKNEQKEPPISMTFSLQDFTIINTNADRIIGSIIHLTGILKTNGMFNPIFNRAFKQVPSVNVLETIANEVELQVENRTGSSTDIMTWLQVNISNYDMINHVLSKSFKTLDNLIFCYVDRDSIMNITSFKEELNKTEVLICKHDPSRTVIDNVENEQGSETKGEDENSNELHYSTYQIINVAGNTNKRMGYGNTFTTYDLAEEKEGTVNSDEHLLTDLSLKEKTKVGSTVKHFDMGIKFSEDNTHENYIIAQIQNEYIKKNFFSQILMLPINATNRVKLFDKITMVIPSAKVSTAEGDNDINEVHSGEWIVGGILHQASAEGLYRMTLSLFRNGINKSNMMEDSEFKLNDE